MLNKFLIWIFDKVNKIKLERDLLKKVECMFQIWKYFFPKQGWGVSKDADEIQKDVRECFVNFMLMKLKILDYFMTLSLELRYMVNNAY